MSEDCCGAELELKEILCEVNIADRLVGSCV